ncbi:hypothetical protein ACS0TY_011370 [Phlomoides rotata]
MEDSFRVRVDKAFGNLSSNSESSVGVTPSLWCLTDEEIEKREWNRNKEVAEEEIIESGPSVVRNHPDSDLNELSHDEEEEEEEEEGEDIDREEKKRRRNSSGSADTGVAEYLDVQSNIGRDCTLDYEEEEDEYDKVAVGMEQAGDRIYMKNVKCASYAVDEGDGYGELPNTFQDVVKDPRANHLAAKIRLREDAEAAGDFGTLQLSDNSKDHKKGESDVDNPKPILKKRENPEPKPQKRVRFVFDPNSSTHEDQQSSGIDMASEPQVRDVTAVTEQASDLSQHSAVVPDYLRNPSKYRRYTFDSSDQLDEESNRKAYMEFFDHLRKGNGETSMEDTSMEMPKSIVFTPRKKPEQDKRSEGEQNRGVNVENKSWSVITAEDIESEVSAMEEDKAGPGVDGGVRGSRKSGRRYRTRTSVDSVDNLD